MWTEGEREVAVVNDGACEPEAEDRRDEAARGAGGSIELCCSDSESSIADSLRCEDEAKMLIALDVDATGNRSTCFPLSDVDVLARDFAEDLEEARAAAAAFASACFRLISIREFFPTA